MHDGNAITLGELVTSHWGGYSFKSDEYTEDGVPVLTKGDIKPRGVVEHGGKFIANERLNDKRVKLTDKHDFLVTTRDLTTAANFLGLVARAPKRGAYAVNQGVTIFRVDERRVDPRYLVYWCEGPLFRGHIKGHYAGATQIHIRHADVMAAPVQLPSMATQRRIAAVLSAYDDLIENNTRRIAILKEMARRIYEEWFVRLRFPGHEKVRMVRSKLGLVPEGWKHCPLGALVEHHIGGGWGQEEANDEFSVPAYVIRGTDIPDVRAGNLGRAPLRFHTPSNFRSRELAARDIVFEVSGGSKDQPVGRAVMVPAALLSRTPHPVVCATFCRLVRSDASQILPELLHLHFERIYANRHIMQYQTQSTGITNFRFTVFLEKEMILRPTAEVQEQFAQVLLPIFELAERLGIKNSNLRTTRDLLLPKLISGELDLSSMTEPEAAAA